MLPKTMVTILTAVPRSSGMLVGVAVIDGAFAVPGFEDGFGCQFELLERILGEIEALVPCVTTSLKISVSAFQSSAVISVSDLKPFSCL